MLGAQSLTRGARVAPKRSSENCILTLEAREPLPGSERSIAACTVPWRAPRVLGGSGREMGGVL